MRRADTTAGGSPEGRSSDRPCTGLPTTRSRSGRGRTCAFGCGRAFRGLLLRRSGLLVGRQPVFVLLARNLVFVLSNLIGCILASLHVVVVPLLLVVGQRADALLSVEHGRGVTGLRVAGRKRLQFLRCVLCGRHRSPLVRCRGQVLVRAGLLPGRETNRVLAPMDVRRGRRRKLHPARHQFPGLRMPGVEGEFGRVVRRLHSVRRRNRCHAESSYRQVRGWSVIGSQSSVQSHCWPTKSAGLAPSESPAASGVMIEETASAGTAATPNCIPASGTATERSWTMTTVAGLAPSSRPPCGTSLPTTPVIVCPHTAMPVIASVMAYGASAV